MTHNERRGRPEREMILALFTGSIYGATHTLTGHPLDTIKSKMQVQGKSNDTQTPLSHSYTSLTYDDMLQLDIPMPVHGK